MKKIAIASTNPGKLNEFKSILVPAGFEVLNRSDFNFTDEIEETASTFKGNSFLKAQTFFNKFKIPTIADDSGLEIEALNGKPGVFSARYASTDGKPCSNEQNIAKILKEMKNEKNRSAKMTCALCFINQFGKIFQIIETCEGTIAKKPEQINGFGYDYIFIYNNQLMSKMPIKEKNKISHRGKALQRLIANINNWWVEQ